MTSCVALVSDAGEWEIGGYTTKARNFLKLNSLDYSDIVSEFSHPLPTELLGQSSLVREMHGILFGIIQAKQANLFQNHKSVAIFCDNAPVNYCLISGTARSSKRAAFYVRDIWNELLSLDLPFQFLWRRRDHRSIFLADALSKKYLLKNPLLEKFTSLFLNFKLFHVINIETTFQSWSFIPKIDSHFNPMKINFVVLPYHTSALSVWLSRLMVQVDKNKTFKFIALCPPILSCKGVSKFVQHFSCGAALYDHILQRPRFLTVKKAFICSNFKFDHLPFSSLK